VRHCQEQQLVQVAAAYLCQLSNLVIEHGLAVAQLLHEAIDLGILLLQLVAHASSRQLQLLCQGRHLPSCAYMGQPVLDRLAEQAAYWYGSTRVASIT